jgi:hypothetical protein
MQADSRFRSSTVVPVGRVKFMKIFLSHKSSDEQYVRAIETVFRESDSRRVKVFSSPNEQDAGNDYRSAIAAQLKDSDCVILLYTDESLQWDWSLYECGYFHGHHRDEFVVRAENDEPYIGRRLFIIHRKGVARPAPLENWESIGVDTNAIGPIDLDRLTPLQSFLNRLFFKTSFKLDPPILGQTGAAKADQLARLSEPLIAALRGETQRPQKIAPMFAIEIPGNAPWPADGDLPNGTMVYSEDRRAFAALGVNPPGSRAPWTEVRTELKTRLDKAWPFWRRTFADMLRDVQEGRGADSALPLLRKAKDPVDTWRPVFDEKSRKRDGTCVITILLADIATAIERLPKDELGSITRLLWMERMFNYGIVKEYGTRFMEKRDAGEIGKEPWFELISEFRHALDMVYAEAMNMGYDRDAVAAALNPRQRRIYRNMIEAWNKCQPLIDEFANERDQHRAWELCYDLFNKMQSMASTMYRIAGKRLSTLMAKVPQTFFPPGDNGPDDGSGTEGPASPVPSPRTPKP